MDTFMFSNGFSDYHAGTINDVSRSAEISRTNHGQFHARQVRIGLEPSFEHLTITTSSQGKKDKDNKCTSVKSLLTEKSSHAISTYEGNSGVLYIGKGCYGVSVQTASKFSLKATEVLDYKYWTSLNPKMASRKVFIGGIPQKCTSGNVKAAFTVFGQATVSWPNEEGEANNGPSKGFVFVIYRRANSVNKLLAKCSEKDAKYFFKLHIPGKSPAYVQVRPWFLVDQMAISTDLHRSVNFSRIAFFGGIPRSMKAGELAQTIEKEYPGVTLVNIETDPHLDYPKGVAKVAFNDECSFRKALRTRFLKIVYEDVVKIVEMKPFFLPEQRCNQCEMNSINGTLATQFCPEETCKSFYCDDCWNRWHSMPETADHVPLSK